MELITTSFLRIGTRKYAFLIHTSAIQVVNSKFITMYITNEPHLDTTLCVCSNTYTEGVLLEYFPFNNDGQRAYQGTYLVSLVVY